jgi:hypothetical protein
MDYKKLIDILRDESNPNILDYIDDAVTAINDLLARAKSVEARAEKAERERNVAIKMLRKTEWCNGCKNFRGLRGCRIGALVTCNPQNDMYVFREGKE